MVRVDYSFNVDEPLKNAVTLHRVTRVTIQGMDRLPDGRIFSPRYRKVRFSVFNSNSIVEEWCEIGDKTVALMIYPDDADVFVIVKAMLIDAPSKEEVDCIPPLEEFTIHGLTLDEPCVYDLKTGKWVGKVFADLGTEHQCIYTAELGWN